MAVIAITGGIAVGKSAMQAYWESKYTQPVFDLDDIGRDLLQEVTIKQSIHSLFGSEVLTADGQLDRQYLKERIFLHHGERAKLEALMHPHIRRVAQVRVQDCLKQHAYCLVVVPLLFETQTAALYDRVCVVESVLDQRVRRCLDRGLSEEVTMAVLQAQASNEQRRRIAHDLIYNFRDFAFFYEQIDRLQHDYNRLYA